MLFLSRCDSEENETSSLDMLAYLLRRFLAIDCDKKEKGSAAVNEGAYFAQVIP